MSGWLILRVSRGNPIKIAEAIKAVGIADALCPKHVQRRRHPYDRRRIIEVRKPIIPGYAFTDRHFDSALIPYAMMATAKAHAGHNPVTADVRVRWLTIDDRLLEIAREDLDALAARNGEPRAVAATRDEIVKAFAQCMRGVLPTRFISFAQWQSTGPAQHFLAAQPPRA